MSFTSLPPASERALVDAVLPRQLFFDMLPPLRPHLDNFVAEGNAMTLQTVREWCRGEGAPVLYVWGTSGVGKSHLLHAAGVAYVSAKNDPDLASLDPEREEGGACEETAVRFAIDDVQTLSAVGQAALFRLFQQLRRQLHEREGMGAGLNGRPGLLLAGEVPPVHLALREDVRNRIGSSLVFGLQPLDDEIKREVLKRQAVERGFSLSDEAVNYLMMRAPRNLGVLCAFIQTLDHLTLERKQRITIAVLREILQEKLPG